MTSWLENQKLILTKHSSPWILYCCNKTSTRVLCSSLSPCSD